ncbi:MFS transporter [Pengzhenrongella frigida]|uniref:MFS transporter n=1 Tax=Pengzhenrongella frigida TaxID=1259133 RepID=A0A4Q5N3T7_9MICO|nr:MFS transporter [Cellulomonas sp. HLT2-17]RYV51297.1 MFS transporter [Cellulomonas sp. HLT2-17]
MTRGRWRSPGGTRARWWAAPWLAVGSSIFAIAWGGNEFTPLLVLYRDVSHFSAVTVNLLLGAYVLGIVPALLVGGPLSDRYGRRPLMLPAAPLSLAGSLVLAFCAPWPLALCLGRVLCGLALGLVMAVGTTWIMELSAGECDSGAGARRASLSLTLGFLAGAGVAGVLAQWGPWPTETAYLVHVALTVVTGLWLLRAPETRRSEPARLGGTLRADLRVPSVAHRRFRRVVVPLAPWVFGCAGSAYAVLPGLMRAHTGGLPIAFSALLTVLTLGCGVGIQVLGRAIDTSRSARASVLALVIIVAGMGLGSAAAAELTLALALAAAAVLGLGYGLALVAGLNEVRRIAGPDDLAGLTAVYYSFAYLGFFIPAVLALLAPRWSYPEMFGAGFVIAVGCLVVVGSGWRAHLPTVAIGSTAVAR